jgi:hypothetical protein
MTLTADVRARIRALAAEGKSQRMIAAEMGCARSTVAAILRGAALATATANAPAWPEVSAPAEIAVPEQDTDEGTDTAPMLSDAQAASFLASVSGGSRELRPDSLDPLAEPARAAAADALLQDLLGPPARPAAGRGAGRRGVPAISAGVSPSGVDSFFTPLPGPDKAALIAALHMEADAFEAVLGSVLQPNKAAWLKSLPSMRAEELNVLLSVVKRTRTVANLTNSARHTFYLAARGLEMGTSVFLKLHTQGYEAQLRAQDAEVTSILRELAADNVDKWGAAQRPELRLALLASSTLLAVDGANRARAAASARTATARPVPANVAQQFGDL